jgi:DNA-binding winged helix-turn-helix (wHTH) protein
MAGPAYQWGIWRFEPSECRLLRDGVVVPLPAKTLDLLAALLRRAPRLMTKEEILVAVWPDAAVEEGNIAFHVAALRKVLDADEEPSAIETVRGRGYRFVKDAAVIQLPATDDVKRVIVETPATAWPAIAPPAAGPAPAVPDRRRPIAVLAIVLVIALGGIGVLTWLQSRPQSPSIAVLPFEIVDPPAGQENFPDGLRTYTITKLELAGVTTVERAGATALLSGQLHPKDGGFSVTVQLTRTGDGARMWEWSFHVPRDAEKPPPGAGPDDERSRLQGAIANRTADGITRYLSLSGAVPVTR